MAIALIVVLAMGKKVKKPFSPLISPGAEPNPPIKELWISIRDGVPATGASNKNWRVELPLTTLRALTKAPVWEMQRLMESYHPTEFESILVLNDAAIAIAGRP